MRVNINEMGGGRVARCCELKKRMTFLPAWMDLTCGMHVLEGEAEVLEFLVND